MTPDERLTEALAAIKSSSDSMVYSLAKQLRDEGISKKDLYALFDRFLKLHRDDADETRYDSLCDTMDFIVGYCAAGREFYPE
jgi:hypothetical protein